jgi:hypothetical protein
LFFVGKFNAFALKFPLGLVSPLFYSEEFARRKPETKANSIMTALSVVRIEHYP